MRRALLPLVFIGLTGTLVAQAPSPHTAPTIFVRDVGLGWVEQTRNADGRTAFKGLSITTDKMIVTGDAVAFSQGHFEFTGKVTVTIRLDK